ncbi:MAG: hypothetical protein AAF628_32580 [Planctomycetota bacterium]
MRFRRDAAVSLFVATLAATSVSAQPQVLVRESFEWPAATHLAPCDAFLSPIPIRSGWFLANARTDFCATTNNELILGAGTARLRCVPNSATGGYPAFYIEVPERPVAWRLTVRSRVNIMPAQRSVPDCKFNYCPVPGTWFEDDLPTGSSAFQLHQVSRQLVLVQPVSPPCTNQITPPAGPPVSAGQWVTIEITNDPLGSEGRIWFDGQPRPVLPTTVGGDLGRVSRIAFQGPNWQDFDYEVDDVLLEDLSATASFASFGTPCPGAFGAPRLSTGAGPVVGQSFSMQIAPFPPAAIGVGMIAALPLSPPFDLTGLGATSCQLYMVPQVVQTFSSLGTAASWVLPIPPDPLLAGQTFYVQGMVRDTNPFGWVTTNGMTATIGL